MGRRWNVLWMNSNSYPRSWFNDMDKPEDGCWIKDSDFLDSDFLNRFQKTIGLEM